MDYRVYRSIEELDPLADAWNALLQESASDVPFLRYEYQRIWWGTLGGGEWDRGELTVVAGFNDGRLAGIAPLFHTTNRDGQPALMLIGSIEISDYLDLFARPDDLLDFICGLPRFLSGPDLPDWDLLDLYNVLDDSPSLPILERAAHSAGWQFQLEHYQHSPYIPLPGDWEAYLAGIDKKQRHEIRRKIRRAEVSGTGVRWYFAEDPATLDSEITGFLALMKHDPQKARFLTPAMQQQMRETIHCAFEDNCLKLAFMEVSGMKAAAYLSFDYLNRLWVYNSGIDPSLRDTSPGWVLLAYLLRWANENHREVFDFLRGNEDYKYRFGAVDRSVMRARLFR